MNEKPAIVLARPQLGENIGAAARVMANFGLRDLRLACPRDAWPNPAAQAMAAGAIETPDTAPNTDTGTHTATPAPGPTQAATRAPVHVGVYDDVAAALADRSLVLAASARPRDMVKPVLSVREAVAMVRAAEIQGAPAVLFGSEASGLSNDEIVGCDAIVTYPVEPGFSSLNLAQAVAVFAFAWRSASDDAPPERFARPRPEPVATKAELLGLGEHLERELDTAGFFHPPHKRDAIARNLRATFARGELTAQEVRTLRGAIHALVNGPRRNSARVAREADHGPGEEGTT